jgi:excisionase family DNA binding protein
MKKSDYRPPAEGARVVSPQEAAMLLGVSLATFYRQAKAGAITVRKIGRRSVILRSDIDTWLKNLPAA